jgi:hypothetical protein
MFIQRFYDFDLKSYPRGYYANFFGIFRVLKFKTNTVMEREDWIFIIENIWPRVCHSLEALHD